jgi:hypothetical protein
MWLPRGRRLALTACLHETDYLTVPWKSVPHWLRDCGCLRRWLCTSRAVLLRVERSKVEWKGQDSHLYYSHTSGGGRSKQSFNQDRDFLPDLGISTIP